jgi:hypothetical protein
VFTDMRKALEAEALHLTPPSSDQNTAASVVAARHARDKDDLAGLLSALGLPCAEDDLVRLLPHLTPADDSIGETMPVNAFTATAASMLTTGDSPEHVRTTLGLSEDELAEAVQHADTAGPTAVAETDPDDSTGAPEASVAATAPPASTVGTTDTGGIEALLTWAEKHPAAGIRNRAARVRSDLTELTERRTADAAQRQAEQRVAKARAELEAAQEQLRAVKTGTRAAAPQVPAAAPAARTGKRSKEELAAIRAWARAHGHEVADRGNPPRAVLDAYDAAHRTTDPAEAS